MIKFYMVVGRDEAYETPLEALSRKLGRNLRAARGMLMPHSLG